MSSSFLATWPLVALWVACHLPAVPLQASPQQASPQQASQQLIPQEQGFPQRAIQQRESGSELTLSFNGDPERHWLSPHLWGNRLQDWRIHQGRLECVAADARLGMRTVHLLTRQLAGPKASFALRVRLGLIGPPQHAPSPKTASPKTASPKTASPKTASPKTESPEIANTRVSNTAAGGFLLGAQAGWKDPEGINFRSAALVHQWPGPGGGYWIAVTGDGRVLLKNFNKPQGNALGPKGKAAGPPSEVILEVVGRPVREGRCRVTARTIDPQSNQTLSTTSADVPAAQLAGNVALVSHPGRPQGGTTGRFWFNDWQSSGAMVVDRADQGLGPIVGTQYTLSRGTLKMTAQLMPVSQNDARFAALEIKHLGSWKQVATAEVVIPGHTATFRVPEFDSSKNVPYRVTYQATTGGKRRRFHWGGTVRADPVSKSTIVIAGFTGNHNNDHSLGSSRTNWRQGVWFPHDDLTAHVAQHDPDVLFFSGDQIYEGRSPTFADRRNIKLDYLYKWYLWCWAYRDLTKDRPTITIPDDHDVYQGNLWGQGGRKSPGRDHDGGYVHPADFVKMVERTQTSHLPDPYDPTPVEQGIGVYYTDLVYGGISIAVLEDRKFKSGCKRSDMPPSGTGRPDHFNDPEFDVAKLDIPGVQLLGTRQLAFLRHWSADWQGAQMKIALSQTIFANMATHHGGGLRRLLADLDSNGWPQTGRNKALAELRRGFAFHLAGDQHLATVVHHGIDKHGDAIWSFCVPSVANFYPRAWAPECGNPYRRPGTKEFSGRRRDGFNHPVTVYAATNPGQPTGKDPAALHDKMPGYGIVRMNKDKRTITLECWPRHADPADADAQMYPGWPKTIQQMDNYARPPAGYLPTVQVQGMKDPVVQVIQEADQPDEKQDVLYTLRIKGQAFRPMVFEPGTYTLKVGEFGTNRLQTFSGLKMTQEETLKVSFPNPD